MRCRRILYYRAIIYIVAVLCAVGSVVYGSGLAMSRELEMTTLDAVLIYAMCGLKRLAMPLLIAYVNMHRFKYDFKYPYIARSTSRLKLWYSQVINVVVDCVVVAALIMIAGAVTGFIKCGAMVDFNSSVSVCKEEFEMYGMAVPEHMNIPLMIAETFVLNAAEIIARVLFALFIYWMINNRLMGVIGLVLASRIYIGDMGVRGLVEIGNASAGHIRYYSALCSPKMVAEPLLLTVIIIVLVILTAHIFIPVKEFVKE